MVGVDVDQDHCFALDVEPDPGSVGKLVLPAPVRGALVRNEFQLALHAVAGRVVGQGIKGQSFPGLDDGVPLHGQDIDPPLAGVGGSEDDLELAAAQRAGDGLLLGSH